VNFSRGSTYKMTWDLNLHANFIRVIYWFSRSIKKQLSTCRQCWIHNISICEFEFGIHGTNEVIFTMKSKKIKHAVKY